MWWPKVRPDTSNVLFTRVRSNCLRDTSTVGVLGGIQCEPDVFGHDRAAVWGVRARRKIFGRSDGYSRGVPAKQGNGRIWSFAQAPPGRALIGGRDPAHALTDP